ncbi:MAG TPA: hypothetical protein VFC19_32600 [Candidatus Limnocylindrales bacterium]|nr:hypothetical protein [Candidatus Limnocylindrales bacterium]
MAVKKPGTERDAFWESYGTLPTTPEAKRRAMLYQAKHIAAIRLERLRLGNSKGVPETYEQIREVIESLHI